ncbi:hypothetical protein RN01_02205 [Cupriavidus sp. SHE]|uniref:hypothetical protein n=1 Tax=Cupriavidus sp. SHE TaxID=1539143 RepID=UPI0004BB17E6|nr:hypothetical protein [Cupriavidus sp. SHE]KWR86422.1 hypothetical protein RN01_02205 [Cupriavidus sp. SHE]
MTEDYTIDQLFEFAQTVAARKEAVELQLELYGGDDPAVLELREQLEERLESLQRKEDAINERVEAIMSAAGWSPEHD